MCLYICTYVRMCIGTISVTPSTTVTAAPTLQPPGKMHVYHGSFSACTCIWYIVHMCNQHMFAFTHIRTYIING